MRTKLHNPLSTLLKAAQNPQVAMVTLGMSTVSFGEVKLEHCCTTTYCFTGVYSFLSQANGFMNKLSLKAVELFQINDSRKDLFELDIYHFSYNFVQTKCLLIDYRT